jgi:hypothetical protein
MSRITGALHDCPCIFFYISRNSSENEKHFETSCREDQNTHFMFNTLRTGSFKLFKRPFPGFLTILTL